MAERPSTRDPRYVMPLASRPSALVRTAMPRSVSRVRDALGTANIAIAHNGGATARSTTKTIGASATTTGTASSTKELTPSGARVVTMVTSHSTTAMPPEAREAEAPPSTAPSKRGEVRFAGFPGGRAASRATTAPPAPAVPPTNKPPIGATWHEPSRVEMLEAEMELNELIRRLDGALQASESNGRAESIGGGGGGSGGGEHAVERSLELDHEYDEEARKLFAAAIVNPIFRDRVTRGCVYVGNQEAASDQVALSTLNIAHIIDCRRVGEGIFSGDAVLPEGERATLKTRRHAQVSRSGRQHSKTRPPSSPPPPPPPPPPPSPPRTTTTTTTTTTATSMYQFSVENYWRYCVDANDGSLCAGCCAAGLINSAVMNCPNPAHTRLLISNEGTVQLFEPAMQLIDDAVGRGHNVLIHDLAGDHRAGTVAIAYLMHRKKVGVREALTEAKGCRPIIDTAGGFASLLVRLDVAHRKRALEIGVT